MTRVTGHRRLWQLSYLLLLGVVAASVVGCSNQPPKKASDKKVEKKTDKATDKSAESAAVKKTDEAKATDVKVADVKPEEKKVEEKKIEEKPADVKPEEMKADEKKPEEKPADVKPADVKPEEKKVDEKKSEEKKPEDKMVEEKPADLKPEEKKVDEKKSEEKPADVKPEEKKADEKKPEEKSAGMISKPLSEMTADEVKKVTLELPTPAWLPKPVIEIPAAVATDEAGMKAYDEQIPGTDLKFPMVPIKGGTFKMGSPKEEKGHNDNEGLPHEVKIAPFWMEAHPVTWDEYELWGLGLDKQRREAKKVEPAGNEKVVDAVAKPTKPYADMTFGMGKEGYPAICMTQFAAKLYCKWLSAKTGRYYRLPTEAEWEYACRAGTTTAYSFGDDPKQLGDFGWFTDNSEDKYHKISLKKPNPWGLFDMHGNVSEWCLDQYVPDFYKQFEGKTADNPLAKPTTEFNRVVRGGSWDSDAQDCRSAARRASEKDWKMQDPQIPQSIWYLTDGNFVGFRVVRPLTLPSVEEAKKYEVDDDQMEKYKEYMEAHAGKE